VRTEHVTVAGVASRAVAPSSATWRAEAVESDDDPRAAFERCSARLNALVERLSGVGEVHTEAVVVQPRFEEGGGPEAVGAVRVRCPAERAGEVAQAAMQAGANRLRGPRFEYEGQDAVREELLADAVAHARRKAERLAAAAGRRLGRVLSVEEDGADEIIPMSRSAAVVDSGGAPDVRPREQTISVTVAVVFALED
jgi:uncharacterized protein YggE